MINQDKCPTCGRPCGRPIKTGQSPVKVTEAEAEKLKESLCPKCDGMLEIREMPDSPVIKFVCPNGDYEIIARRYFTACGLDKEHDFKVWKEKLRKND